MMNKAMGLALLGLLCLTPAPGIEAAKSEGSWLRKTRGLKRNVLRLALRAYACARKKRKLRKALLTIVDYSLPSSKKRLWVLDMRRKKLLYYEWVSHGKNTGGKWARRFSNRPQSKKSNLGVLLTAETYRGKHGLSLRLDGLERGFNHHARKRAIVIHGAWYVSRAFLRRHGRLGRSWGCPAVRKRIHRSLLRKIKGGSLLFLYYPHKGWLKRSKYLRCRR